MLFALELIMLSAGILYTPGWEWSRAQIDCMLAAIGTRDYSQFLLVTFYYFRLFMFVLYVRIPL